MTRRNFFHYAVPNIGAILVLVMALTGQLNAAGSGAVAGQSATMTTISYQGRLTNASGAALTTTLPMTFKLYAAPSGGTALWTEARSGANAVPVTNGLFNVLLGSITPVPISLLNRNLWLGITVNTDAEMTPREKLGTVPYAARAGTVVDGVITSPKLANGAVTEAKIANGSVTSQKLAAGAASKLTILDVPSMMLYQYPVTVPGNPAYQRLDLSSVVPPTAKAVLFDIGTSNGGSLAVRTPGVDREPPLKVNGTGGWDFGQGWVRLSGQAVEYKLEGGNLNYYIQVVGFLE